ncbi:MAG: Barrel-sandwich domain of CusB or HlyD rane-fusion [Verrucomicrobiota bacterium]|jgi:multidrug resistance efflux pump
MSDFQKALRSGWASVLVFAAVAFGVVVLWRHQVSGGHYVGRVELVQASVSSVRQATVVTLKVGLFDRVEAGAPVAVTRPSDLEVVTARLAAEIESLRSQLIQNEDRIALNYQQLRLEWMRQNVELSAAKVELELAQANVVRSAGLVKQNVISTAEFQLLESRRDSLSERVTTLSRMIREIEPEIARLRPVESGESVLQKTVDSAIRAQQSELKALEESTVLRAPMEGVVSLILKRPGEVVVAAEPLLVLSSDKVQRVVAYRRQPLSEIPSVGDPVQIQSRRQGGKTVGGRVIRVGGWVDAIPAGVLTGPRNSDKTLESGLPVLIELQDAVGLVPGELVGVLPAK